MEKLKGFFGGSSEENKENRNINEDEYYDGETTTFSEVSGSSKMILFEPRAYSESQQIADYLKKRNAVVVNLKRVTPDQAKRIVDFLSGTLYAINGDIQKLGGGIFLCTPNNVNVEGKISDDNAPTPKSTKTSKKSKVDDEEDEFNW